MTAGIFLAFLSGTVAAGEKAVSFGYGIAALNIHKQTGRIEGGRQYDFFQFTFLYERPCSDYRRLALFFEPFAAYVNRPSDGADFGLYTGLKWYPMGHRNRGLFATAGTGLAYSTVRFKEQGTHLNFTLEIGLGYRFKRFFIEDRLRHYSNGACAHPNRSVNANIVSLGMFF
jgi:hypothetical protein